MVKQIDVHELARRISAGEPTYLVDVRQPWEHEIARLPASLLIPLAELTARTGEVVPPEGALVVTYCHHGVRSLSGATILMNAGIADVHSLAGGIDAWSHFVDDKVPRY